MIYDVTDSTIGDFTKGGVSVIDCYADWCSYCKKLDPVLEQIAKDLPEINYARLNIDESPQTPKNLKIELVPTLIVYRDGKVIDQILGLGSKEELEEKLKEYLKVSPSQASF
jgi:thioredoxin 1